MSDLTATDIALMREAIALAGEADAPFGAVIVKDGRVLAHGRNSGQVDQIDGRLGCRSLSAGWGRISFVDRCTHLPPS
jgi:hypothetical protein